MHQASDEESTSKMRLCSTEHLSSLNVGLSIDSENVESSRAASRSLYFAGLLLLASGLFHIFVWLHFGGEWEGSVSWRKPILFGISTGLTLLSISWVFNKLRPHKWDVSLCCVLSISLVVEVGLITLQQWRGQASHFNHNTTFDSCVEYLMTALIIVATVLLFQICWRAFSYLDADPDIRLSIQAGMMFLLLSCVIGFWVLLNGQSQLAVGRNPSTFGKAGVTKFPHGVAIHALQMFPILCWMFQKFGLTISKRVRLIRYSVAALGVLLVFSLVQTLLGKARFELTLIGVTLLSISMLLLVPILWSLVGSIRNLITTRQSF